MRRLALLPIALATSTLFAQVGSPQSQQETTCALSNGTAPQIAVWLEERSIDPEMERVLRDIVAKREAIEAVARQRATLDEEQERIFQDQERLRENLAKLGGSREERGLRQRYVSQLDEQETRLQALRGEREALERQAQSLQSELDALIRGVAFERNF